MADHNFHWIICLIFLGWFTTFTTASCQRGYFGWKCLLRCEHCLDDKCDPVTGECLSSCRPGYWGHHCMLSDKCIYDSAGLHYRGNLNYANDGKKCQFWSEANEDVRKYVHFDKSEYPGQFCRNPLLVESNSRLPNVWCFILDGQKSTVTFCNISKCNCSSASPYLYGPTCSQQCHCRDPQECSESGICHKSGCADGWIGRTCHQKCDPSFYGPDCAKKCEFCRNEACNHETGRCLEGCPTGYTGEFCDQVCNGSFGPDCATPCGNCKFRNPCHPKTGLCEHGCLDGYGSSNNTVALCDITCGSQFRYGPNCVHRCGSCKDSLTCDSVTGECEHGCQDGYQGKTCTARCPEYFYGAGCLQRCGLCKGNSSCDPFTGRCADGCGVGHTGFGCRQEILASSDTTNIAIGAGIGVGLIMIIIIIVIIVINRRNRFKNMDVTRRYVPEVHDHMPREESCQLLDSRFGSEPPSFVREEDDNMKNEVQEPIYVNINNKKQSSPVQLPELYDYILKNKEHYQEGFKREFEELPMGLLASCVIARKPENKTKNRYGNIVAYDHSRVLLDLLQGEPFSDYVNANYMDGYSSPKAYIASQGPNKVMIRDFWRMIWQHRVSKIVMLTNLTESCKKKCEQYWPDEGSSKYGDLTVFSVNTTKYTDFIIRTFEVTKECERSSRIVKQFHFTAWSDHGVPTYPTTLLAFRRKVLNFKPDDTAPILSHCSAGIGRTGTYIAVDFLLEQAITENQVDVLKCAQMMRSNRVNMIQTLEQYVFVYDAVLEGIISGNTTIPRSVFHSTYEDLVSPNGGEDKDLPIQKQYDVLQLLSPSMDRDDHTAALRDDNISKNRFKNILPADRFRPFLYTTVDGCNDYINAVYLSGYTQKDQFIVTQMPLPETVADFWRMLYDTSSDTIIMLNEFDRNDKSCALYWPEEYGYSEEHGPLSVELLSSSEADLDVTVRVFKLSHKDKREERAIKQFMFKSWPDYQTTPNTVNPLLRLHRQVNEWLKQNSKGPVTIHCMNGASKSGVFAAMSLLLERLELDFEVDVYQTAKQIRITRPQFVENVEQYKFLYQIVQEYMDQE